MTEFRKRHNVGIELTPTDLTNPDYTMSNEGELSTDSNDDKLKVRLDGATRSVVTEDQTQTLTNKTIDADVNTISDLEVDNLKAGVLNTSTTMSGASDSQIPSALAIKTYVDNGLAQQNQASEISYDNTTSGLTATNVQAAIDELDTDLSNHINDTTDAHDASAISNIPSGNLAATDVQSALNELQSDVDTRATSSALSAHTSASSGVHGVTGSVVGTSDTQTLSNKTIDADQNTISNIDNADIKVGADIARSKLASGTNNAILVNNGSGVMSEMANASDSTNAIVLTSSKHIETQAVVDSTTTGSDASISAFNASIVILTNSSLSSIANIPNGANGRHLTLINRTGSVLTIKDSVDALGTAANRIFTGTGASISLANNAGLELKYDSSVSRWQIIGGSGSGDGGISEWITAKAYAIGDIVYNGTGIYKALTNHTSTVFATDLAAGKWVEMSTTATVAIDDSFSIKDSFDPTKQLTFNVSGTTGTLTTFFTNQTANRLITIPDATDTLVARTTVDTLTNKTIVAANNTITTAASGNLGSTELNASLAELQGDINLLNTNPNYILNNEFSVNVNGWATYADAAGTSPVDGTGGSANVTFTRTTSTPLFGIASALLTKDAVNRQGQGFSYDFTIDEGMKTKVNTIRFDYQIASGTYATGDLTVWIYDVTNGALIQPAPYQIQNSGIIETFISEFQATTSLSYRLIVHVSSTSASAYTVKFDNFYLGRAPKVYGSVVTDWVDFTPTGNWTTNTTYTGKWRRVGDVAEIDYRIALSGTPTAIGLNVSLPTGLVADFTKYPSSIGGALAGSGNANDIGVMTYPVNVYLIGTTTLGVVAIGASGTYANEPANVNTTVPFTFGSGDVISFSVSVKIQGWGTTQQLSSDVIWVDDVGRVDAFAVAANNPPAGYLYADGSAVSRSVYADLFRKIGTTHGSGNGSTTFNLPDYRGRFLRGVDGGVGRDPDRASRTAMNTGGNTGDAVGSVQSDQYRSHTHNVPSANSGGTGGQPGPINAGGTLNTSFNTQSSGGNETRPINAYVNYFIKYARTAAPQVAASDTVSARYTQSSGQSIPTSFPTVVDFNTKVYDSHNAVTTGSSWRFTAPISGEYSVVSTILFASSAWPIQRYSVIYLRKNGVNYAATPDVVTQVAQTMYFGPYPLNAKVKLLQGEYIDITLEQNRGSATSIHNASMNNWVEINRVGNY